MNNTPLNHVSIEKIAAYLDGNLSLEETKNIAELITNDASLSNILDAETVIDNQIHHMIEEGFELPSDLVSSNFPIPQLDNTVGECITDNIDVLPIDDAYSYGTNESEILLNGEDSILSQNYLDNYDNMNSDDIASETNDLHIESDLQFDI